MTAPVNHPMHYTQLKYCIMNICNVRDTKWLRINIAGAVNKI